MSAPPKDDHYEVLGVPRRASSEQIEKAYRFMKQMYEDVSLATYTLLDPEEMRTARARVNQAYEVLADPERRREYDAILEPPARSHPVLAFAPAAAKAPAAAPAQAAALSEPVTGEALRRFRQGRGVSLQDISTQSKVGVRFLEYIESDRHDMLPARVYLRSFLIEYSRSLGLDPVPTAEAYIAHMSRTQR